MIWINWKTSQVIIGFKGPILGVNAHNFPNNILILVYSTLCGSEIYVVLVTFPV